MIADPETGAAQPAGESGEVWIRSAHVLAGYWGKPEETAAAIRPDGWFRTGDGGRLDADGYLYLSDRIKDMIKSGGENIYPAEIERVLVEHPEVAEVAVIGVPHPRWDETPKAYVVAADGVEIDADELIEFCRGKLARYKCPTAIESVPELPRNATGKILKRELRLR
jgi:acyl-CoA synthetase (AMP-forming)/AMP-acid ligase II